MKYKKVIHGCFESRPNRFIAKVWIDKKDLVAGVQVESVPCIKNQVEMVLVTVHVKNTGRCKEILLPGTQVILEVCEQENRKTKYDLIIAWKEKVGWINIDSQAPNKVVKEWLEKQDYSFIKPEYTYGESRVDFYMEKGDARYLLEVKGCTQEIDGIGYFPDAPTLRGVKHLYELANAVSEGYHGMLAFVIQMEGIVEVRPNVLIHKEFGEALVYAQQSGVEVIFLCCSVTEDELVIIDVKDCIGESL